jgi:hypothetical protein
MSAWWNALSLEQQVFAAIALIGSALLAIQVLLMLIGLEHSDLSVGDADTGGAGAHASGLSFLSIRSLIAFTVGFGWTGWGLSHSGYNTLIAVFAALAVGLLLMATVVTIMRSLVKLTYSGSLDYRNAVGQVATVYMAVPAAMAASGQVEVLVQGRIITAQAMTKATAPLAPRTKATVVALVDRSTLLVEPLV